MIAVAAGVIRKEGKILVYRRPEGKKWGGYWEFPGGKLEKGETPEEALARELKEEIDIRVEVGPVLDVLSGGEEDREILLLFYECVTWDSPRPMEKGDFALVSWQEMKQMRFAPIDRRFLARRARWERAFARP